MATAIFLMAFAVMVTTLKDLQREFEQSQWKHWEQTDGTNYWKPETFTEE
jgi:precorrin-6B methylase 2